jgi:hypothetical protein
LVSSQQASESPINEQSEDEILEQIRPDFIEPGASVLVLDPIIVEVLGGAHGGAPTKYTHQPKMPPP